MVQKFVLSPIKKFWNKLGPGFITGSSDDDPSGVATYASSGASFGYSLLWTTWFTVPLMIAVQEMSARIGLVSGRGVIGVIRHRVPRPLLFASVGMVVVANSINIGANIGAMADASRLLIPNTHFALAALAIMIGSVVLQVFVPYKRYVHYLKWLTLSLFSYIGVAFYIHLPWNQIIVEFVMPTFSITRETMLMITAIFGTTISPYLMFWQASEEVEDQINMGRATLRERQGATRREIKNMRFDINFGMIFSNVVAFFIMMTTAAVLFGTNAEINTAADAARVLEPLAGKAAGTLFALGILGAGFLSIPVLAGSAAYAVSELFGWRSGLGLSWRAAKGFYAVIALATAVGVLVNFVGIPPMKALVWTAVINGFVAPFTILALLVAGNDKAALGEHVNGRLSNVFGVVTLLVMASSIILYFIL